MHGQQSDTSWRETDNPLHIIRRGLDPVRVHRTASDTSELPTSEQFSFWRDTAASSVGLVDRSAAYDAPFSASSCNYFTSKVVYSRHSVRHPSAFRRDNRHIDSASAEILAIQLRLNGVETENSAGTAKLFAAGDIRIADLSRPLYSANLRYDNLAILVSKRHLADKLPGFDRLHGVTLKDTAMTRFLKTHMVSAWETVSTVSRVEAEKMAAVTLEMLGAALLGTAAPEMIEDTCLDGPVLRTVRQYIKQHLDDPALSTAQIAHGVGVSRAKLFRVCRPHGTPMALVRHQRLHTARALMTAGTVHTVAEAAYRVGYEDRSSFSRAFRNAFGIPAREFLRSGYH